VNCLGYQHERILTNASLALCSISENDAVERHNIQLHGLVQHLRSADIGIQYASMMGSTSTSSSGGDCVCAGNKTIQCVIVELHDMQHMQLLTLTLLG
jgi:hypothetical protein